jgi:hypothetical protein
LNPISVNGVLCGKKSCCGYKSSWPDPWKKIHFPLGGSAAKVENPTSSTRLPAVGYGIISAVDILNLPPAGTSSQARLHVLCSCNTKWRQCCCPRLALSFHRVPHSLKTCQSTEGTPCSKTKRIMVHQLSTTSTTSI